SLDEIPFGEFSRPVIISGARSADPARLRDAACYGTGMAVLLSGPNAFGAALLAEEHGAVSLEEAIDTGRIRGITSFEADIPARLLNGMSLAAAVDCLPTEAVHCAQVFLPATAWVEMDGTFINNEGRAQRFRKVMEPGLPIRGLDPAGHPPRVHRRTPPGGEPRPAWQSIAALITRLGGEPTDEPLGGAWKALRDLDPEGEGKRIR
ncbi:NADH-quinone oxidoreductase subunit NuoG, partial [bacterium]|nr:NADH-quinone oxidoreductase subunit NuoG [bacterium]